MSSFAGVQHPRSVLKKRARASTCSPWRLSSRLSLRNSKPETRNHSTGVTFSLVCRHSTGVALTLVRNGCPRSQEPRNILAASRRRAIAARPAALGGFPRASRSEPRDPCRLSTGVTVSLVCRHSTGVTVSLVRSSRKGCRFLPFAEAVPDVTEIIVRRSLGASSQRSSEARSRLDLQPLEAFLAPLPPNPKTHAGFHPV